MEKQILPDAAAAATGQAKKTLRHMAVFDSCGHPCLARRPAREEKEIHKRKKRELWDVLGGLMGPQCSVGRNLKVSKVGMARMVC